MNVVSLEVINSIGFWNEHFKGFLQGSTLNVSEENSGDTGSPFLGLHIYYVLYK